MNTFINRFSKRAMNFSAEETNYLKELFESFLNACSRIPKEVFSTKKGELNAALFDCIFTVVAEDHYKSKTLIIPDIITANKIDNLKNDIEFIEAITHSTSHTKSVEKRINKAREYLL